MYNITDTDLSRKFMSVSNKNLYRFYRSLAQTLIVFVIFAVIFFLYARSEKAIDSAYKLRVESLMLTEELRQTTDQLTHMALSYAATDNPIYKRRYQEILDIRNGRSPRPIDYHNVYWDLIGENDQRPRPYSDQSIALLELMRQSGFTEAEIAKLSEAKKHSDALSQTEHRAMDLAGSDPLQAMKLLQGEQYRHAKTAIMQPISEVHAEIDKRTFDAVKSTESLAMALRIVFILLGIILLIMLWRAYRALNSILGGSLKELYTRITQIGSGDFTSPFTVEKERQNSVLGWLSETQIKLSQIDAERKEAEKNSLHMTQLYATLSLCNEAIIRSKNEAELFSKICQDAVSISHIKMAWIGEIDDRSKALIPVSFCGSGTDYLKDLLITADAGDPSGQGPSGTVCREDRPVWSQDFLHDPSTATWHERARAFGWKASAALPLHRDGVLVGTFNLYSDEANVFDELTRSLLQEMTTDIDHALSGFAHENARKKAEEALTTSYNLLMAIINTVPARIFWKDKDLNYLGCNLAFAKDAGETDPQNMIGKSDYQMTWHDQAELYRDDDRRVIESNTPKLFFEEPQTTPDGQTIWLRTSKVPLYDSNNTVIGILGMYDDITEQKLSEIALRESQQHLQAIIENEPECVKLVDPRGKLIEMNPAGLAMLQADTLEEAQKHSLIKFILPEWRTAFIALHKEVMNGNNAQLEFEIKGLKGERRWLETHAVPMRDEGGKVTMLLGITRDVTQRKQSELRIQYLANFDTLTGLPNRHKLDEQLTYLISLAKRSQNNFSLLFIDIDNFKDINDTLGHNTGDTLLVELAKRIRSELREEDTVARLGGDEFILLLPNINTDGVQKVAQKMLHAIQRPFSIERHELNVTASIGIAIYPTDGLDKETLSKNADAAMYRAKAEGRNGYAFFTDEMQTVSTRKLQLVNAMYHALTRNELYLVYQPQISMKTGHVIGAEALLRWQHPEFGAISPAEFIPLAENCGLILTIGEWVLRTAAEQLKSWMDSGMPPMIMAVNLSAVQFRHPNLPDLVSQVLKSTGLPPEYLELELTESVAMHNPQEAINIMNKLHQRGVRMSIDDFGTGYSSLSYLKKFKVYKLKIDQSFVRDISIDPEDRAIVGAVINMARSLGLHTIAEGVETIEQLNYLTENGCNEAQGYYFNKPLPPEQFERIYSTKEYLKANVMWLPSKP
jgi:diguanylate cyclase (GGDEF)-like protein/PAS domain S-box-containing protein